jgi:hypothetical protein
MYLGRVAVNVLNKKSWTDDKGRSPAWGLGMGLTTPHHKNHSVTKFHKRPQIWMDFLDKVPKLRKMDMRFSMWNIQSLYRASLLIKVARELVGFGGCTEGQMGQGWHRTSSDYAFSYGKQHESHELGSSFSFIRESYQQLRGYSLLMIGYCI